MIECWREFLHSWWSGARNSRSGYSRLAADASICTQVSWTVAGSSKDRYASLITWEFVPYMQAIAR